MNDRIANLEIINSYPLFKANQVLRENQLNDIVKYLEQQDRLSRICLMGTGIVCGLEADWDADNSVLVVSAGTGVTSEGYLVKCDGKSFAAYRSVNLNLKWFGAGEKNLEIDLNDVSNPQVWELERETVEDEDQEALDEGFLTGKVLVLVLESLTDEGQGLCGNDCDEKGISRNFLTHYLLMDKDIADKILLATYDPTGSSSDGNFGNMNELFYYKFSAIRPVIERFGLNENNLVKLNEINTYNQFINRYETIIKNLSARLDTVFNEVNKIFSPVFVPKMMTGDKVLERNSLSSKISSLLADELNKPNIQYVHDYLCDLVHAYDELIETVYEIVADCPPNTQRYPKFLWITGFQVEGDGQFSRYRTPYTQPPVYNGNQSRQSEAITLYKKLKLLLQGEGFQITKNGDLEIKVTPSKSDVYPLSQRAVPFYYKNSDLLVKNWSPRLKRVGREGKVYSYFRPEVTAENMPYGDPLIYRMESCDFFRIEGHIGKPFNEVICRLCDIRQHYNLSFEMVALKIGGEFDDALFQFICEDLNCERRRYADQYASLRNRVFLAFHEGNFPNELNQILPEDLKDFKIKNFSEKYVEIVTEHQRENLPSRDDFGRINDCYIDLGKRWQAFKDKHLFHNFALDHPGMEHRGGVPIGGTFILAYIDSGDSQSRTIVADFYLPYSCVSGCVPISIVAQRPRPVLQVSPSVFCEGETDPTELEIRVQPEGGIITGPGYTFDEGTHLFTPSESGITEGKVELKYYVDGGEATYNLTIVKRPEAGFTIVNDKEEEVSKMCQDGNKLTLKLASREPEGKFTVWHGEEELTELLNEDESGNYTLDPMKVFTEEPLLLYVRYTVKGNLCGNQLSKDLTILPLPDAEFSLEGEVTVVCMNNTDRIGLRPNQEGGNFTAHIGNSDITEDIIRNDGGLWYIFNLSAISLELGQSVQVTIRHTIITENNCGSEADHQLTIWRMEEVDFDLPNEACQNGDIISLNPKPDNGTFEYNLEPDSEAENLINAKQFDPSAIKGETSVKVTVTYTVEIEACSGSKTKTIEIHPVPKVDFEARFIGAIENPNRGERFLVNINNVQPDDAEKYSWKSSSESLGKILNDLYDESVPEIPVEFDPYFEGKPWIELSVETKICQSETISKQVLPAIDYLALIIILPATELRGEIRESIPLQKGTIINKEKYGEGLFIIQATTIPQPIFSVAFDFLKDGNTLAENSVKINDTADGYNLINEPNQGFKLEPGTYVLKSSPIMNQENGDSLSGLTTEIPFSIVEGEAPHVDVTPGSGLELTDDLINFLRRRDTTYRNEMADLATDASLARTASFQKTEAFLNAPRDSHDFEEKYFDLVDTLEKATKRTDSGGERQGEFFKLMEVATKHFMDREIVKSPDNISEEILSKLTEKIAGLEEIGFNRETLTSNWAGESLKNKLNAPVTESFVKAITKK